MTSLIGPTVIIMSIIYSVQCQDLCEDWFNPKYLSVDENESEIPLTQGVFTLISTLASCDFKDIVPADSQRYNISNVTYYNEDTTSRKWTFDIYLNQAFDREKMTTDFLRINAVNWRCGTGTVQATKCIGRTNVIVGDVKDESPVFESTTYQVTVPENSPHGGVIIGNISATDPDLRDNMAYSVTFEEYQNQLFRMVIRSDMVHVDIELIGQLDFEDKRRHTFILTATDSVGLTGQAEVIIDVSDVQDMPPVFTRSIYNGRVAENVAPNTPVLSVEARDGDIGAVHNNISYRILHNNTDKFHIDENTGIITTTDFLDIDDDVILRNGLVNLTVLATELDGSSKTELGTNTSSTAIVLIQVDDANDNRPEFNADEYFGTIREDALVGELVTLEGGGYVAVKDKDQMVSNNQFRLRIEKDGVPWDIFKTNIETQYSQASVLIQLNKENALVGLGDTRIHFQIVATDMNTAFNTSTSPTASVAVWIKAKTTLPPPPEPLVDLPLSTSDIIIFIVGIVLLFNLVLTIFLCYMIRRGKKLPNEEFERNRSSFLSHQRHSKYYVSERKKSNGGLTSSDAIKQGEPVLERQETTDGARSELNHEVVLDLPNILDGNHQTNTVVSTVNRNRCDLTNLDEKSGHNPQSYETTGRRIIKTDQGQSPVGHDNSAFQMETSMNILKDEGYIQMDQESNPYVNVPGTSAKTNGTAAKENQSNEITDNKNIIRSESRGLADLIEKAKQKLESGRQPMSNDNEGCTIQPLRSVNKDGHDSCGSSFSEHSTGDVAPLIKKQNQKEAEDKQQKQWENDVTRQEHEKMTNFPANAATKNESQNMTELPTKTTAPNPYNQMPTLSGQRTQLTQTGVPPIALALPLNNAPSPKLTKNRIINPVYGTQHPQIKDVIPKETISKEDGDTKPLSPYMTKANMEQKTVSFPVSSGDNKQGLRANPDNQQRNDKGTSQPQDYMIAAKDLLKTVYPNNP